MTSKYHGFLASSTDPSGHTLSLTVESLSKTVIGLIAMFAVSKGFDPALATTQIQAILDLIAQAVPMAFTFWSIMHTVWGLVRKLFASYFAF